jgi:hypothetical protein
LVLKRQRTGTTGTPLALLKFLWLGELMPSW